MQLPRNDSGVARSDPHRLLGVDSYAYNRLLGETRPAETQPPSLFGRASLDVIVEARALENHGDLTAAELEELLERVDDPALRVCFDTANALRVGDNVTEAAKRLAPYTELVHLKDSAGTWDDDAAGPVSVPPGAGVIPLDGVLAACPGAHVCVELGQLAPHADERALVGAYVAYLRAR